MGCAVAGSGRKIPVELLFAHVLQGNACALGDGSEIAQVALEIIPQGIPVAAVEVGFRLVSG